MPGNPVRRWLHLKGNAQRAIPISFLGSRLGLSLARKTVSLLFCLPRKFGHYFTQEVNMRKLTLTTASVMSILMAVCGMMTPRSRSQEIAQSPSSATGFQTTASNLIIPQARVYALHAQSEEIEISEVATDV